VRATDPELESEDWQLIFDVVDRVNDSTVATVISAIIDRLNDKSPNVQILALTVPSLLFLMKLAEAVSKNCPHAVELTQAIAGLTTEVLIFARY